MDVTVIIGKSESGDDYGPWVFYNTPSEKELEVFLREECVGEFPEENEDEGPGIFGSYLYVSIHEIEVLDKIK